MRSHRNDPCFCGSGKKFKRCCGKEEKNLRGGLFQPAQPPSPPPEVARLSLHERNMMLINAVATIFGLGRRNLTWADLERSVTPDAIRELYHAIGSIWCANPEHLIPRPSSSLAALYLGDIDPEGLARRVFRFGLYTDEIYMIDPFQFPAPMGNDPFTKPEMYKNDTLHLIEFLGKVEPWIRSGRLTLIPEPMMLDPLLRARAFNNVEKRKPLLGPPTEEEIEDLRDSFVHRLAGRSTDLGGQFTLFRGGTSLESMQRICDQSGAFPFTYSPSKWQELFLTVDKMSDLTKVWSPLTNAFSGLEFDFLNNVDPTFAARLREEERLLGFRQFLKDVWQKAGAKADLSNAESAAKEFRERLGEEYRKVQEEFRQIRRDVNQWGMGATGVSAAAVLKPIVTGGLDLKLGLAMAVLSLAGAAASTLYKFKSGNRKVRATLPMSVFVDLSKYRAQPPQGMSLTVK